MRLNGKFITIRTIFIFSFCICILILFIFILSHLKIYVILRPHWKSARAPCGPRPPCWEPCRLYLHLSISLWLWSYAILNKTYIFQVMWISLKMSYYIYFKKKFYFCPTKRNRISQSVTLDGAIFSITVYVDHIYFHSLFFIFL